MLVHAVNDASRDRPRADGPDLKQVIAIPAASCPSPRVIHDEDWQSGYQNIL